MLSTDHYLVLFGAFVVGVAATWITRSVVIKFGWVNEPNPIIPQHTRPIAHLGGVGIGVTTAVVMAAAAGLGYRGMLDFPPISSQGWAFAIVGFGFLILGTVDDLMALAPRTKFVFQAMLAVLAAALGVVFHATENSVVDFLLSAFWIITLVNAVNVTDVCDGFVASIAAIAILFWAHFDPSHATIAMGVAGAALGFLVFNYPPASIFLGDVGSHFLGFTLAFLMLVSPSESVQEPWLRAVQMALVSGIFLFEVVLLIVVRRRKGIPWYRGSPDHISLRLQAAGLSRRQTDAVAWCAVVLLCVVACLLDRVDLTGQLLLLAAVAVSIGFCWKLAQRGEVTPA